MWSYGKTGVSSSPVEASGGLCCGLQWRQPRGPRPGRQAWRQTLITVPPKPQQLTTRLLWSVTVRKCQRPGRGGRKNGQIVVSTVKAFELTKSLVWPLRWKYCLTETQTIKQSRTWKGELGWVLKIENRVNLLGLILSCGTKKKELNLDPCFVWALLYPLAKNILCQVRIHRNCLLLYEPHNRPPFSSSQIIYQI